MSAAISRPFSSTETPVGVSKWVPFGTSDETHLSPFNASLSSAAVDAERVHARLEALLEAMEAIKNYFLKYQQKRMIPVFLKISSIERENARYSLRFTLSRSR